MGIYIDPDLLACPVNFSSVKPMAQNGAKCLMWNKLLVKLARNDNLSKNGMYKTGALS